MSEKLSFKRLTMEQESTGKITVLYENGEFKNFNLLHQIVGEKYDDLNDDLMDGVCESNGWSCRRYFHFYDEKGEWCDTLHFQYEPTEITEVIARRMFEDDCEDIAEQCEQEGYPSHGSNYDLRVSNLQKEYQEEYPDWFQFFV